MRTDVLDELKRHFSPEFLNRIDELVVFDSLTKEHLVSIVDILLGELNARLVDRGVYLEVSEEVKQWLIDEGFESQYGARPLRRTIQRRLGDPLSEELIKGRFKDAKKIKVVLTDQAPVFHEEEVLASV